MKSRQSKIVGYIRVSTNKQEHSIQAQEQAIERYAQENNATIVTSIVDVASGKNNNRVKLQQAIDLAKGEKARLVVAKLDRLSRDVAFIFNLQAAKIDFVALDLPDFNTMTLGVFASVAQHEREIISQRTKAGLEIARQKGKKIGGARKCKNSEETNIFRAQKRAVKAIKENAKMATIEVSRVIAELLHDGLSMTAIAAKLNRMEIKSVRGGKFYASTVKNIIKQHDLQQKGQ